ncbi:hypothetical protein PGIGA_G00195140, partial [Pangasianodon gigas]|nr:hypothetical protein [Pangasianodon gigas]
ISDCVLKETQYKTCCVKTPAEGRDNFKSRTTAADGESKKRKRERESRMEKEEKERETDASDRPNMKDRRAFCPDHFQKI